MYETIKVQLVRGRYLPPETLDKVLTDVSAGGLLKVLGHSVQNRPIPSVRLGSGPIRVLMWSQMHGNESTTTKALLDLMRGLKIKLLDSLDSLELLVIPMLNPDGAAAYTRLNANAVDLNRDALELSQPESLVLRKAFEEFRPHFCFNLHDQRTLFGVGVRPDVATLSLLAPAANPERSFPENRKVAARLASLLAKALGDEIGIGRYDDTFNMNCVGDFFQAQGVPTLLFEAGHYPGDYQRETSRYFLYRALITALQAIQTGTFKEFTLSHYQAIPENKKCFVDILIRNAHILGPKYVKGQDLGIRYEERLLGDRIDFKPQIAETGKLEHLAGHIEWDLLRSEDLVAFEECVPLRTLFG